MSAERDPKARPGVSTAGAQLSASIGIIAAMVLAVVANLYVALHDRVSHGSPR
jgi:hypothetical protein